MANEFNQKKIYCISFFYSLFLWILSVSVKISVGCFGSVWKYSDPVRVPAIRTIQGEISQMYPIFNQPISKKYEKITANYLAKKWWWIVWFKSSSSYRMKI